MACNFCPRFSGPCQHADCNVLAWLREIGLVPTVAGLDNSDTDHYISFEAVQRRYLELVPDWAEPAVMQAAYCRAVYEALTQKVEATHG